MKNILAVGIAVVCSIAILSAQSRVQVPVREGRAPYPIAGSHLLHKDDAMVQEYFRLHPEMKQAGRLRKGATWGFVVGSTKTWKAVNTSTNAFYNVPSTCKAVGTHCYVFVEDASWGSRITQTVVDSVRKAFDDATPANASKGIFQTDVDAFGDPPDVDGDPKIIILILDIQDGYDGGGYVAGYFHSVNELPTSSNPNSNQAEIYYLDCDPANLTSPGGLVDGMSTTAHEFQHMIHFNYDDNEISFVNEGCSLVAEVNAGYSIYSQSGFTSEPNHYLFDWRSNNDEVLKDYSRAARFMVYCRDQFSMSFFKPLVQSASNGVAGINAALSAVGSGLGFSDVLRNWLIANALNSQTIDPAYGYVYPGLSAVASQAFYNPNVGPASRMVQAYSADYISFVAGTNLSATITLPNSPTLHIKMIKSGSGGTTIEDVASGSPVSVPELGSSVSKVTFIVLNNESASSAQYTLQATGTAQALELKYDTSEPAGYLPGSPGDTVCVVFDAVADARLDSVRIAIRRAGTMKAGVWRYTGTVRPTPLGTALATNLNATVTSTPSTPYPVPWPNWATVDVSGLNISAGSSFAVGLVNQGDASTNPRVMITESPIPDKITSLSYLTGDNWYYLVSNDAGDSVFTYLIRAYVSFVNPDGVRQTAELEPSAFSLDQNFPNPFNPTTTIRYVVPQRSPVTLKVYDLLGKEVASLVNEVQEAGEHRAVFRGANIPSGMYFYTVTAGRYSETRKMLLIK